MSTEREIQVYSYTLNIQSVKMKVKFPCKMKLQYAGEILTQEVNQNETGKFIFNQQVTLKEDTDRTHFEIIANIATEKGAKYMAGVIKLAQAQLVQQEGEMIIVNLVKCLDAQACCQLRVDQVSSEKVMKKVPIEKMIANKNRDLMQNFSPKPHVLSPGFQNSKNNFGTKSQFQFPLTATRPLGQNHSKDIGNLSIFDRGRSRSPTGKLIKPNIAVTHVERNFLQFCSGDTTNRDKLIEAEVYKQSYQKLKQKYKKQSETAKLQLNRRIALQNNENNYKLQIMRLKLRCEEQQKSLADKNSKIKDLQLQLVSLQKKELDLGYVKEEVANKDHTIRMLEDTIRTLNRDNEDLKNLNKQRFENQQDKIRQLRAQLDENRFKYQGKIAQFERELKFKGENISQKDIELKIREQRILREQKLVDQLEKSLQAKAIQYEKSMQTQQSQWRIKAQEFKAIITKLEKQKTRLEQQLQNSKSQHQKIKTYVLKIEYDKKVLTQENDGFKSEVNELKIVKQKYQQLQRDHRLLTEDKTHLQKQYEKTLQTKDSNISEITKQHQQQIQHYRKIYKEVQEKLRNSQNKIIELESSLEQKKNENEKMRRNIETLSKEANDLKQKQKVLKKSLKTKQQQYTQLSTQLQSSKYKFKNDDQLSRYEIQNLKEQLSKAKRDLDEEVRKSVQLTEKISNLSNELNKNRLQLQYISGQGEKDGANNKEKISTLENYNREYERRIEELNTLVTNLRSTDKENQTKIQKFEVDILKSNERIEKLQKQIRIHEEKGQYYENQLKNKQNQIANGHILRENLEKKITEYEQKLTNIKNNLNTTAGQKNKNDKIIELLNRQMEDFKQEIDRLNKIIQAKEKQEEDLRAQLKKSREEYLKLQMKNTALKKQYQKFKDNLVETLTNSFSQIPLNGADFKASSSSIQGLCKRNSNSENYDSNTYNAQILGKVASQNKDVKIAMTKLIEQNKLLQKEIQRISQQGLSSNAKTQLNEAALNKRIEELEDELQTITHQKQEQAIKNSTAIRQLQLYLQERENTNKEFLIQIEQSNFTINSLQMDQQASAQHFDLKSSQFKSKIAELEEKINYLNQNLNETQGRCHELEIRLGERNAQLQEEKDNASKKQKQIRSLTEEKRNSLALLEDSKKQRKELLEKISELELKLSTEIELKQKGKSLLQDEERKGSELKQFVANLMKQKQLAIKGDLEKSQQIISLQASLTQANREKEMKDQQIERLRKSLQQSKQSIKKLNNQLKDMEILGSDEKGKSAKLNQKLREKERDIKELEASYNKLKTEMQALTNKSNKNISLLEKQLEEKVKKKDNEIEKLTNRLTEIEKQLQDAQSKVTTLKSEIVMLQENLFMEKQTGEVKTQQASRLSEEIEQHKEQLKHLEQTINALNQQLREKQENMFQFSGKIYQLQSKLEAKENESNQKIAFTIDDWTTKYQNMAQEYQQRIELVEKEKNYFKSRLEEKEEEYRRLVAEHRNNELQEAGMKKVLEEKVRRLQQERLTVISSKNTEIQRLVEDNKAKFQSLKTKQSDLRKLQQELQVARSTISKLEQGKRQSDEKMRQINKAYQSQLEQLKKKEVSAKSSAIELQKIKWSVQREIKRSIQSFSKKVVPNESKDEGHQKILLSIKGLEDEVVNTIHHKISLMV